MARQKIATGGKFTKNEELAEAAALLIRPRNYVEDAGGTYHKPAVYADLDIFHTVQDIKDGTPEHIDGAQLQGNAIVGALKPLALGNDSDPYVIVRVDRGQPKPGQQAPWVLRDVDAEADALIEAYAEGKADAELGDLLGDAPF